jgi:ribosomal protein S12 methylthiotransferase
MGKTVGLVSLGCAKNLVNSEQMLYLLSEAGFEIASEPENADAVVINTCGFIESAKAEAIDTILEFGRLKSDGAISKIIVAGCLAERYKDEILGEMPEVDAVVGVGSFGEIVEAVSASFRGERAVFAGENDGSIENTRRILTNPGSWAYLKIADGCDNRCAFCVIPDIRGRYISRPMESVLSEARELARGGIREIIVVAQDITRYGLDLYGERRLTPLLRNLAEIDGIQWIRLHYLYPDEIDDELIDEIARNERILKYLDIPIQHINDGILAKMRRRGTGAEIRALIKKLRERIPGVVIRTSLITGLPGEGEREFDELCDFLRESKLERVGVFAYSPEEGTAAFDMDRPDVVVAESRAETVAELQSRVLDGYNASRVGTTVTAVVEWFDGETYSGRSFAESPDIDGVIRIEGENLILGGFAQVLITEASDGVVTGRAIGECV